MGVRLLNTFLQSRCQDVTKKINLQDLRNKRIVVDASIYMYRFSAADALIENTYMLCSLFRHYGIRPLFVRRSDIGRSLAVSWTRMSR